ncbi:glycosyltransferase [Vibrio algarum]|uniref:Glycosyltransferase n=1 Tax=Vibrio algarum TaxID=3020714 RepID=A0ABT4YLI3_9VIBR|nr:glycosyltransferase [Vibrio sp. KJ40-1]MDB1122411.1 glycosyltransferase [Vibrio sp. KJ40-1]
MEAARTVDHKIVISGDGPLREELKSLIFKYNLKNVILTGFISEDEKKALLRLCKAFVFPSQYRSEAFGVSLLEAQLFKKPIISCNIGTGSSFVNIHNKTGIVVPPKDVNSLSLAMNHLAKNDSLCHQLGESGFSRFSDMFTIEKQSNSYVKLYNALINGNKN